MKDSSTAPNPIRKAFGALQETLASLAKRTDLVLVVTLLLLLLRPPSYWYVEIPLAVLCIIGVVYEPARREPGLWFLLFLFVIAGCAFNWSSIDNHKYLTAYWCLAIFASLHAQNPGPALAANARYLLGLCFLFAALSKLLSPDYLDGRFFHYTLLTDDRFRGLAEGFGNMGSELVRENRSSLWQLFTFDSAVHWVKLQDTPELRLLARVLTIWTLGLESLVALVFLVPEKIVLSKYRDVFLLLFVVTTYSVATVIGFGWLLVVMGLAQAEERFRWLPLAYIGAFLLLELYLSPWSRYLVG